MFADVVELREFYGTRLGQVARRMVARRIRQLWPDITGMRLLGLGYATPYLRPFLGEAVKEIYTRPVAVRKPRTRRVLLPMPGTPSPVGR
jgi:hypothetical protein